MTAVGVRGLGCLRLWALTACMACAGFSAGAAYAADPPPTEVAPLEMAARQAYERADFAAALRHYDQAITRGNAKPTLLYNRAVVLYRMNRLTESATAFGRLLEDSRWGDLARYNLGLIAIARGQTETAARWLREVKDRTSHARLRTVAERKLAELQAVPRPAPGKKTAALLSLGAARDDNATGLAEELAGGASDAADTYLHALAYGHYKVGKSKVYGLAQVREFQHFDHFNTRVAGAGLARERALDDWRLEYGARILHTALEAGTLANQGTVSFAGSRRLGYHRLNLRYSLSRFAAPDQYRHLDGWQNQVEVGWQQKFGRLSFEPALLWESNRRTDKTTRRSFHSYSPNIVTGRLHLVWDATTAWQFKAGADWAQARYRGENRLTDIGGTTKQSRRRYDRTTYSLGARYSLDRHWALRLDYQNTDSDDRFELYSYHKNVLLGKIEFSW